MKLRHSEDYYFWCCNMCDSGNLILWAKLQDGATCSICKRPMNMPDIINSAIATGLC